MIFRKNYKVYAVKKRAEIIVGTVNVFPYKYPIMENSTENGIKKAAKGIIEYLQNLELESRMENIGNKQGHDPEQLVLIMIRYTLELFLRA